MLKYIQPLSLILLLFGMGSPLCLHALSSPALMGMDGQKIVIATEVLLRESSELNANILGRLTLGSIVKASKRTREKIYRNGIAGYWYYVTHDTKKGWVFGSLLRDFKIKDQESIYWRLVKERRAKKPSYFVDYLELHQYIRSILPHIKRKKIRAALELDYLISLQKTAQKIPFNKYTIEPYSNFLKKNKKDLLYDEISGRYLVPSQHYWRLAKHYQHSEEGDKITWYAANVELGGECEGDISCIFLAMTGSTGLYLNRYPQGVYAENAMIKIIPVLNYMLEDLKIYSNNNRNILFSRIKVPMQTLMNDLNKGNPSSKKRSQVIKQLDLLKSVMQH